MRIKLCATVFLAWMLGLLATSGWAQEIPRARLITVVGEGEVKTDPDEVVLNLGVDTRDKTLASAKAQHDGRMKKLQTLARDFGIENKNMQTSRIWMGPEYYGKRNPTGFAVSQTIQLTLRDLSKYESLMTALLDTGVNRVLGVEFRTAESQQYKDQARTLAVRAAREKAAALASELGQKIGRPWSVVEETTPAMPRLTAVPRFYGLYGLSEYSALTASVSRRDEVGLEGAGELATIAPGQLAVRARVTVSFELE